MAKHDTLELLIDIAKSTWNTREYIGYSEQRENQDKKSVEEIVEEYHKWDEQNPNTIVGAEIQMDLRIGDYIIDGKIDQS